MKQTFVIKSLLPSMNEIINSSKTHWSRYSRPKKILNDAIVAVFAKQQVKPVTEYPVDIYCHWIIPNKRKDPDNISAGVKFVLDGLVNAGILRNDGQKEIKTIHHKFSVDKLHPRIEVTLEN